jgi:hypothetical protein
MQIRLFVILASFISGRRLRELQAVVDQNGFEAWRQLVQREEPRGADRKLTMLEGLLQPKFHDGMKDEDFESAVTSWERDIAQYEQLTGTKFDRDAMTALVVSRAPIELQRFLRVTTTQVQGNFDAIRTLVRTYTQSAQLARRSNVSEQEHSRPHAMEVDYIAKGKSRGSVGATMATKAGTPSAAAVCHRCGGYGHYVKDCPSPAEMSLGKGASSQSKGAERSATASTSSGKGTTKSGSLVTCYRCGKKGHMARDCNPLKGKGKSKQSSVQQMDVDENVQQMELSIL